ncbi:MAG: response regulator [Candidatus Methylomirabilis sp.]|nr:response regulator [Deltaproteobacteria bacterium]
MQVSSISSRAEESALEQAHAGYSRNMAGGPVPETKQRKILVVDDEETVGLGMSEILRDEGFEAAYAVNGIEAVEAVKDSHYSLIFMDMIMPGMNGLETFREIRKIRPAAKVVLFTGYFRDAEDAILQGVKEGMIDEFIRKPYFADEIVRSANKYA